MVYLVVLDRRLRTTIKKVVNFLRKKVHPDKILATPMRQDSSKCCSFRSSVDFSIIIDLTLHQSHVGLFYHDIDITLISNQLLGGPIS